MPRVNLNIKSPSGRSIKFHGKPVILYGEPPVPPPPPGPPVPTANYFQLTNRGNACKLAIYSATAGQAFVNDVYLMDIPVASTIYDSTIIDIPAGAVVKLSTIKPMNNDQRPLFGDVSGYLGDLSIDRFNEQVTNYEYGISDWNAQFTSLKAITSWAGAHTATTFKDGFNSAGLVSLPSSWVGLTSLTSLWGAFNGCEYLAAIPDSWEGLENVTSTGHAFQDCHSLRTGGDSGYSSLAKVDNTECMFYGWAGVMRWTGHSYDLYNYLANKSIRVTSYRNTFTNCTSSVGYSSIPSSWK